MSLRLPVACEDRDRGLRARAMALAASRTALALAGVLVLGLVLRIVFWYGMVNVDSYAYADSAAAIARWQPVFDPDLTGSLYYTQYVRLSLTIPAAVLYRLFGPGEVVSTVFPIACSLGTGVVAFCMARRAADDRAGIFAAFLAVVFPLNVINSTQFLPDTVMTFFASLTMLLFLMAFENELSRRNRALLYAAAGVSWALAFYARPTAVALMIPFGLLILVRRRIHPEFAALVAGGFAIIGLMNVLTTSLGAGFLEDIRTILTEGRGSQAGALGYADIDWTYFKDFLRDPMFVPTTALGLGGLLVLVARSGWRETYRGPAFHIILLVVGQYLYFEFLMRLPGLYSWWKEPRYILSLMVPLFVLAGVGMSKWLDARETRVRKATAVYVAGGLLFAFALSIGSVRDDHAYWETHRIDLLAQDVADFLDSEPEATVYTWNDDFARYLSFHAGLERASFYDRSQHKGLIRNRFDQGGHSMVTPGSFVVIHPGHDAEGRPAAAPGHWELAWEREGVLAIYRVPLARPVERPMASADRRELAPGVTLIAGASEPARAFPQQHVLLVLQFAEPLTQALSLDVSTLCAEDATPTEFTPRDGTAPLIHSRMLPAGSPEVAVDVPVDTLTSGVSCSLFVRAAEDGNWVRAAEVRVPVLRIIEPDAQYTFDRAFEQQRQSGWYRNNQPLFSAGGSVVAIEPWRELTLPMEAVSAGDYRLDLAVYDYGDGGENAVRVRLNGVERELRWGGDRGAPAVLHVIATFEDVPAGADFTVMPIVRGQDGLTIDSVILTGIAR